MKNLFPKDKKEWKRFIRNTLLVLSGTFVLAFAIETFIFPFDLVTGGVSSIGIILEKCFDKVDFLSEIGADVYSSIANWILFTIGFFLLGKSFAAKTLVATVFYPIALSLSSYIVHDSALSYILDLKEYITNSAPEYFGIAYVVASIFGGALIGTGCALTFLGGGSTGGVDVISLSVSKYCKRIKSSTAFFVCDAVVILVGVFVVNNFILSLLGIASALICAISIDKIFLGESGAFIAHVVSDKYEEINTAIIEKLSRTTTIIDAVGGYSGTGKKLVMITFNMRQYPAFTQIISSIDKNAFVTVHRAHEINGEGWTYDIIE